MMNIQRSLRGALLAGPALLLLACGDMVNDPTRQRFLGCDLVQVYVNESRGGLLSSSDCIVDGTYTEMWYFDHRGSEDQVLVIDLESFDFDAYLVLYDYDTGEIIAENDDVNDSDPDARLVGTLARGRYVIAATTFQGGETGQYVLTVD